MTQTSGLRLVCAAVAMVVVAGGCASRQWPAPVVDRTQRSAAPKPAASAPAPAPVAPAASAAPTGPDFYTVKRGDTLYSIALDHGADYRDVAQWNSLDDPTKIQIGQTLRVTPPEARGGVVIGSALGPARIEARPLASRPEAKAEPSRAEPRPEAKPQAPAAAAASPARPDPRAPAAAEKEEPLLVAGPLQFVWPVKGKVIAGFSEPRNKGIDIDGRIGDPVVAAAAGRVTYVGAGIPRLGKLVVIKHDQGFITVYAHNKDIVVKEQQAVERGQKIAELGNTDSDRPKLHFQIRKGAAAVDPLRYLPAS